MRSQAVATTSRLRMPQHAPRRVLSVRADARIEGYLRNMIVLAVHSLRALRDQPPTRIVSAKIRRTASLAAAGAPMPERRGRPLMW